MAGCAIKDNTMSNNILEIYYSFQNPYCHLLLDEMYDIERDFDVEVLWQPFSAKAAGATLPPTPVNPDKLSYLFEDTKRSAEKKQMPIIYPQGWPEEEFDPGRITRGALIAQDMGVGMEYNIKVFNKLWGLGEDPGQDNFLNQLCDELDVDLGEFLSKVASSDARERVKGVYKRGKKAGVFDTPTFVFEGSRYFGPDKLPELREVLKPFARR